MAVARVVLDVRLPQLDRLFDYRIPEGMQDAGPGMRVRVPVRTGARVVNGWIVEVVESSSFDGELLDLDTLVSQVPVLAPEVWRLAREVADRAAGNAADILRVAIPTRSARAEKAWLARRADRVPLPRAGVLAAGPLSDTVEHHRRAIVTVPPGVEPSSPDPSADDGGEANEVWVTRGARIIARAAAEAVARGESAIIAVPDWREQRLLRLALDEVLDDARIVELDARQGNAARARAFVRALDPEALVMLGPRSAIYAPAHHLGLIVVWEDGDPLHREPLAPWVHTRDAALVRQAHSGAGLILAGTSVSTEAERLAEIGFAARIDLDRGRQRIVPTALVDERPGRIPSAAWRIARAGLDHGPVLIQVGSPGVSTSLRCRSCGTRASCAHCHGPLRIRRRGTPPSCAWCGQLATTITCTECGGHEFRLVGAGSERTAFELARGFPNVPVTLADGDHPVTQVDDTPRLVVATRGAEPVAAGGYRAVLLLDGERMLARESLRVVEDCVRWWRTARSLAHDEASIALVGVDASFADALRPGGASRRAADELADRRQLRLPPAVRVATCTGDADAVERAVASVRDLSGVDVLGPVPVDLGRSARDRGEAPFDQGAVRSLVRLDYGAGTDVATLLRAALLRSASGRRAASRAPALKVRFDDPTPFED